MCKSVIMCVCRRERNGERVRSKETVRERRRESDRVSKRGVK